MLRNAKPLIAIPTQYEPVSDENTAVFWVIIPPELTIQFPDPNQTILKAKVVTRDVSASSRARHNLGGKLLAKDH